MSSINQNSEDFRNIHQFPSTPAARAGGRFAACAAAGYLDSLIPIIPVDATLSKGSKIDPSNRGKTPGLYDPNRRVWVGYTGWPTKITTAELNVEWDAWESKHGQIANIGLRLGKGEHKFQAADHDEDFDAELVEEVCKLRVAFLGDTLQRGRPNTPRTLALYRTAEGDEPLGKHRIAYSKNGRDGAFEWLGVGNQCVILGRHKSGTDYCYPPGKDPISVPAADLPCVSSYQVLAFLTALEQLLIKSGYEIKHKSRSGAHGEEYVIGDKRLMSRDFEKLARAHRAIKWAELDYPAWITALHASKQACGGSREFFLEDVLPENLDYPGNDPDLVEQKWDSIKTSSIGADYIYFLAGKFGFAEEPERTAAQAEMDAIWERYIFIEEQAMFFDKERHVLVSPETLDKTHVIAGDPAGLRTRASYKYVMGLAPRQRTMAYNITYWPGAPTLFEHEGKWLVNKWHASIGFEPEEGDITPYIDLLNRVYPDSKDQELLLNKMAFALQHPELKSNWHILQVGTYGAGKDTLLKPMFEYSGENGLCISAEQMITDFNEYIEHQLLLISEVKSKDGVALFHKLKSYAATPPDWIAVNAKNRRLYRVANRVSFWLTANDIDALGLDKDDRRFCVLRSPMTAADARALSKSGYFIKLYAGLNDKGAKAVVHWLLHRQIPETFDAQGFAPWTAAKGEMAEAVLKPSQQWIVEQVRDTNGPLRHDLTTVEEVIALCRRHLPENVHRNVTKNTVAAALKTAGAKPLRKIRLGGRGEPLVSLWSLRFHEMYETMAPLDLRMVYLFDRQAAQDTAETDSFNAETFTPADDPRLKYLLS